MNEKSQANNLEESEAKGEASKEERKDKSSVD